MPLIQLIHAMRQVARKADFLIRFGVLGYSPLTKEMAQKQFAHIQWFVEELECLVQINLVLIPSILPKPSQAAHLTTLKGKVDIFLEKARTLIRKIESSQGVPQREYEETCWEFRELYWEFSLLALPKIWSEHDDSLRIAIEKRDEKAFSEIVDKGLDKVEQELERDCEELERRRGTEQEQPLDQFLLNMMRPDPLDESGVDVALSESCGPFVAVEMEPVGGVYGAYRKLIGLLRRTNDQLLEDFPLPHMFRAESARIAGFCADSSGGSESDSTHELALKFRVDSSRSPCQNRSSSKCPSQQHELPRGHRWNAVWTPGRKFLVDSTWRKGTPFTRCEKWGIGRESNSSPQAKGDVAKTTELLRQVLKMQS
ncbi:hypothetical protein NMY22_g15102 [Coprinellus aureogranulatus]|nr:hypothetical protein NMY22_g15102 [Coprinellus aureogranulatus]